MFVWDFKKRKTNNKYLHLINGEKGENNHVWLEEDDDQPCKRAS